MSAMFVETLKGAQLYAKCSKCSFLVNKVAYLGYVVSNKDGLSTDPTKVEAVNKWPIPKFVSEVRGFLGLTRWCQFFIKNYALIASPLIELIKNDKSFLWTDKRNQAFNSLKEGLSSNPILKLPNFKKTFQVREDASTQGIGGILQ